MVSDIYNSTLRQGKIPELLNQLYNKGHQLSPQYLSVCRPRQLRTTFVQYLQSNIAKVMEGSILEPLLADIGDQIDPYQFAMKGRSTTQALVFLLHILETLDRGGSSTRVFFADFNKGFDLVDHGVLIAELEKFNVRPAVVGWIRALLTRRKQCVRICDKMSSFKCPNGGIPQGTNLGPILTTIEFIPRCSLSVTPLLVNDIYDYASTRGMRLNSKKCKEMIINFLSKIINQARIKQRSVVITLLDLKNAFGEVHHNLIQSVLDYHHIPTHVSDIIKSLYTDFNTAVITSEFSTPFITVGCGVHQGDCLNPLLLYKVIPEPTARSAVPGVSPGRGLLIPHGYLHPGKSKHSEV